MPPNGKDPDRRYRDHQGCLTGSQPHLLERLQLLVGPLDAWVGDVDVRLDNFGAPPRAVFSIVDLDGDGLLFPTDDEVSVRKGRERKTMPKTKPRLHILRVVVAVADQDPFPIVQGLPVPGVVGVCGRISRWTGKVVGSLPEASISPNSTSAMAVPPSWPVNQTWTMPMTSSAHGISTGRPAVDHHHGARVGRGYSPDERVLVTGQLQSDSVLALRLPTAVCAHDHERHVGPAGCFCGRRQRHHGVAGTHHRRRRRQREVQLPDPELDGHGIASTLDQVDRGGHLFAAQPEEALARWGGGSVEQPATVEEEMGYTRGEETEVPRACVVGREDGGGPGRKATLVRSG